MCMYVLYMQIVLFLYENAMFRGFMRVLGLFMCFMLVYWFAFVCLPVSQWV